MTARYNENDAYAAQWLRNLIHGGLIAPGVVDERDVRDVRPDQIGDGQFHAFAGIGIWSVALRTAGVPDNFPAWTVSCPCQPFSQAGEGLGFADERHLWPFWLHLAEQRRPAIVFGEQVGSRDGLAWLDLVQADLEGLGYACGAIIAPAAGYGAPHGRHRVYWMAHAPEKGRRAWRKSNQSSDDGNSTQPGRFRAIGVVGQPHGGGWFAGRAPYRHGGSAIAAGAAGVLDNAIGDGRRTSRHDDGSDERLVSHTESATSVLVDAESEQARVSRCARERRATAGFWADAEWIPCRDGKWRAVEPGTFPLAHGYSKRVEQLRAYGNAVCFPQATEFVRAAMAAMDMNFA